MNNKEGIGIAIPSWKTEVLSTLTMPASSSSFLYWAMSRNVCCYRSGIERREVLLCITVSGVPEFVASMLSLRRLTREDHPWRTLEVIVAE